MRGISWLSLRCWFGGSNVRWKAARQRRAAKNQARAVVRWMEATGIKVEPWHREHFERIFNMKDRR